LHGIWVFSPDFINFRRPPAMTECTRKRSGKQGPSRHDQITFSFGDEVKPTLVFDAEEITTDAGLVALRELDERLGLTELAAGLLEDLRVPEMTVHPLGRLLREMVYAYAAGYEDANDHTPLRDDPLFKQIVGPINRETVNPKVQEGLASEATISRLLGGRKLDGRELFAPAHVGQFGLALGRRSPEVLTLDMDGYDAEVHGMQQLGLFNGYYEERMYYPLHVTAAEYGFVVGAELRPGDAGAAEGAVEVLEPILRYLHARYPATGLRFRADSGFMDPKLYRLCEAFGAQYAIRLRMNARLKELFAEHLAWRVYADQPDERRDGKWIFYHHLLYRAQSWKRARRVILKLVYDPAEGEEEQYALVTNVKGSPRAVWSFYGRRGREEQRIDEFKNHLRGEKFSCGDFADNAFKLQLVAMAHNLYAALRMALPAHHALKRATVSRLRLELVKCAAMVIRTARRLWLHASRHWPYRPLLVDACRRVTAARLRMTPVWDSG